ncbi:hypothetical protein DCAR_0417770 [Daucus carota subsp. sativus]|uniref:Bulb-type lectin domain-containing protein n=1 Tax=Daucus carota subsp. sativus TaxID=79200 RepID=A0AAF0WYZ3_DAUCS|nr:PREDICTED: epidermis-specific secreted glycoprotein EP1-like [Daucus carota subsp. sativus]WOG98427.1 hypothetical protein DCAR_0417770 [Daucus carota subsp. sativus]
MAFNLVSTCLVFLILFIHNSPSLVCAQPFDYPTAKLSTTWINDPSAPHSVQFGDGSTVRAILIRGTLGQRFACGFYCNGKCDSYLLAIFLVQTNSASMIVSPTVSFPQVVWSANRDHPVKINATLKLTSDGDLVLRDADGSVAWSTKTAGKSVAGLALTDTGNLVLHSKRKAVVWQSFDHPTDALVPGQTLTDGQKLISSVSKTDSRVSIYSFLVNDEGVFAYIQSNPPQNYYTNYVTTSEQSKKPSYVKFLNGSLGIYPHSWKQAPLEIFAIPPASSVQYMRLEFDGHLRVYEWKEKWKVIADLLTGFSGKCTYPLVCGKYGICSSGKCSCPGLSSSGVQYFREVQEKHPNLGCAEITPLNCSASKYQDLLELKDVDYFSSNNFTMSNIDVKTCKSACVKDCSCKAAIFRDGPDPPSRECLLLSEVFSLQVHDPKDTENKLTAYLKVQKKAIK